MLHARGVLGLQASLFLGVLLFTPLLAIATLAIPLWSGPVYVLAMSTICFLEYRLDKQSAKTGSRRTSEKRLHLWELLGGWPGAFVAQRELRHKSVKTKYQSTFWLIVFLHQVVAVDLLLDWKFFGPLYRLFVSGLEPSQTGF